jgi:hypothetical protein
MSTNSLMKKVKPADILVFCLVAYVAYLFLNDVMCKKGKMEGFEEKPSVPMPEETPTTTEVSKTVSGYEDEPLAPVGYNKEISTSTGEGCNNLKFVSTNLLPKGDVNLDDTFAEFSPANLEGQNFLDSRNFTIGMQSQVLRNANLQLRSEPQNPTEAPCAWNQSTIAPETRREMDIGAQVIETIGA